MKKIVLCLSLLSSLAFGASFKTIEFETVGAIKVPKSGMLGNVALHKTGSGIRQKKVMFFPVNIYQATLLVSDINHFARDNTKALESMLSMPAFALQLHFLRDVNSEDVVKSFEAALGTNKIKDSAGLTNFKTVLRKFGTFMNGHTVTISADKAMGNLSCMYDAELILNEKVDAKLFHDIFSIWLGTPADDELGVLKTQLIGK